MESRPRGRPSAGRRERRLRPSRRRLALVFARGRRASPALLGRALRLRGAAGGRSPTGPGGWAADPPPRRGLRGVPGSARAAAPVVGGLRLLRGGRLRGRRGLGRRASAAASAASSSARRPCRVLAARGSRRGFFSTAASASAAGAAAVAAAFASAAGAAGLLTWIAWPGRMGGGPSARAARPLRPRRRSARRRGAEPPAAAGRRLPRPRGGLRRRSPRFAASRPSPSRAAGAAARRGRPPRRRAAGGEALAAGGQRHLVVAAVRALQVDGLGVVRLAQEAGELREARGCDSSKPGAMLEHAALHVAVAHGLPVGAAELRAPPAGGGRRRSP